MSEKTERSEEQSAVKLILAFRFSHFPRKRAGINPSPPSNVLGVQAGFAGCAMVLLYCLHLCQAFIHSHVCESERMWSPLTLGVR